MLERYIFDGQNCGPYNHDALSLDILVQFNPFQLPYGLNYGYTWWRNSLLRRALRKVSAVFGDACQVFMTI